MTNESWLWNMTCSTLWISVRTEHMYRVANIGFSKCHRCCRLKPHRTNSPVSKLFFPSSDQPNNVYQLISQIKTTVGCIAIFHKYCCYIKHSGIITNLILGGILLICQYNKMRIYGAWIRIYFVLCSKTYNTFRNLFLSCANLRQTPSFVRLAFYAGPFLIRACPTSSW